MALQVWLPLNGDLHNQGLSNISLDSLGTTIDNNGKIGKCIKFTTSKSLTYTPDFNNQGLSLCGWFKFNESEIATVVNNYTYDSTRFNCTGNLIGNNNYAGIGIIWTTNNIYSSGTFSSIKITSVLRTSTAGSKVTAGFDIEYDKWIHICLTWDPNAHILSLYKDGVLFASITSSTFSDGVSRSLFLDYNAVWGGNGPTRSIPIYMNDIRVYDHCLSKKEVKEISQGLVLHYKLDTFEYNNLLPTGVELYDYIESSGTQWIDTGIYGYMNHKYVLDYQQIGTGNYRVWGVLGQLSYVGYNMSITYSGGRCVRWSSTSNGTNLIDNIDTISNTDRHTFIIDNGQIYYDGVNKGRSTGHSDSCIINYPIYLFTVNPANTTPSANSVIRIYSYKDYDSSGNLIRNMLPCTYFGKAGMWDTVENKFYKNQGTGTFILGTKIILKEYEYLQSSGTQWIDTGYQPNTMSTDMELKFQYLYSNQVLVGANVNNWGTSFCFSTSTVSGNNVMTCLLYNGVTNMVSLDNSTIYTLSYKYDIAKYHNTIKTKTRVSQSIPYNIYLFGTNNHGNIGYKPTKLRIYEFKLWENGILIHNMVPCTYSSEPGMWDKVEWKFYANAGTGTFTLGPEKTQFNKIYDCSGYGNNGTITGNLTIDNNSLRYNSSILFNGQGLISTTASGPYILTMSIWSKDKGTIPSDGLMFKDHLGDMALGIQSNRLYSGKSGGRGAGSTLISNINYITNTWHHWVMVNRDNTYYVYMDGQQVLSGTSGNWSAGSVTNALHIGGRSGSSPWPGSLSDFRAYATALSESDILKLYNNPAHIDNKNNLYGFEFDEENITNPKILKRGIVEIDDFIEPIGYIYLPAGTYINTELNYANNDVCKAETVIKYESGGSGRDLMGYSASGGGYWGVTASGSWEPHGTFTYTNSDITKKNTIVYIFSSASEHGIYRVGVLNSSFSVRGKYIYRVKLYKNDILERDLYPIKVGNKVGLYDLITNRYYLANNENGDIFYEESNIKFFKKSITTNQLIEK